MSLNSQSFMFLNGILENIDQYKDIQCEHAHSDRALIIEILCLLRPQLSKTD